LLEELWRFITLGLFFAFYTLLKVAYTFSGISGSIVVTEVEKQLTVNVALGKRCTAKLM
jgi:arginine utilization protein RocB